MKKIVLFLFTALFHLPLSAQNGSSLIQAFSTSYDQEAEGNYDEAIAPLKSLYRENSYELNLRLGWLYYLKGDYIQSKNFYAKAMTAMPYAIEAKLGYVLPEAAMGNWNRVVEVYEEILKIDPKNTLVNYRLGAIYYERKEYEKAYKYTELVVNLYPFDYDSVVLLAWINLQTGNTSRAKALFHKALMVYPESDSAKEGLKLIK